MGWAPSPSTPSELSVSVRTTLQGVTGKRSYCSVGSPDGEQSDCSSDSSQSAFDPDTVSSFEPSNMRVPFAEPPTESAGGVSSASSVSEGCSSMESSTRSSKVWEWTPVVHPGNHFLYGSRARCRLQKRLHNVSPSS